MNQNSKPNCSEYEEAVKNAQEVLALLVEEYRQDGQPLPVPRNIEILK